MKMTHKTVAMAMTALALLSSCSKNQQQQMQGGQQAPEVQVMDVVVSNSELQTSYPATIKGKTDIDIRPQISGFITKVCVDEGEYVHKGQTLFTIDRVQYEAAVTQARAGIEQAQAMINSAQAAVNTAQTFEKNQKTLYDKGIISQTQWQNAVDQLNQAKAQVAQAKAGLSQAQAALTSAQKNLSYTVVTAPSDGVVGSIPNREGSLASPSSVQPLTTISDISEVYAYFSLTEKELLQLSNDGATNLAQAIASMPPVELKLANGQIYGQTGKVSTVSGVIDNNTGSAQVRALFPNQNGMLRSGSTGQVIIPVETENIIIIPQKATSELQDKKYAFVLDKDNVAHQTPIEILDINDGQSYVVTEGLKAGDRIVVEGVGTAVRDNTPVQPLTAEQAKARAEAAAKAQAQAGH